MASCRCWMARMRTRKSSLEGTTSLTCPISMPRSRGPRVARLQVTVSSRCVRSGARRREVPVNTNLRADRHRDHNGEIMVRMNYFALLASVIAAFVASSVWYSPLLFGKQFMELSGVGPSAGPSVGKVVGELGRNLILAYVLGRFVVLLEVVDWKGALNLGVWLWIGFPVLLLSGSLMWQNVPWMLAAIHAGDWLVKILLIAVILGVWRR